MIRGRCGVYSGDCRQEVAPWQDTRGRSQSCSTDWFYWERAAVGAAVITRAIIRTSNSFSTACFESTVFYQTAVAMSFILCMNVVSTYFSVLLPHSPLRSVNSSQMFTLTSLCLPCLLAFVHQIKVRFTVVQKSFNACHFFRNCCVLS